MGILEPTRRQQVSIPSLPTHPDYWFIETGLLNGIDTSILLCNRLRTTIIAAKAAISIYQSITKGTPKLV